MARLTGMLILLLLMETLPLHAQEVGIRRPVSGWPARSAPPAMRC
ncbi:MULTISPECIES: hypothetical protein [Microvirga]|nr:MULTISPECIES: hypothetical protein [unclassified Microvirga]